MLCVGNRSMSQTVPIFKNSQSSWGYKYLEIIPPCGKGKMFLGCAEGVMGVHQKGHLIKMERGGRRGCRRRFL